MPYRYTDVNTRSVWDRASGRFIGAGLTAQFWYDAEGTDPADISLYDPSSPDTPGVAEGGNSLTVQADSMWPAIWDLGNSQDHLYVQIGTVSNPGDLYRVYCDSDQRLDALDTRLSAVESGGGVGGETAEGAQAKATAAYEAARQRANHTGTQSTSTITGLDAALDAKADLVDGVIPTGQIPSLTINDTFPVESQAEMLALTAERGDVAIRTDLDPNRAFLLASDSPSTLADWKEITAAGSVTSVNGQSGVVALAKGDIGLGSVDNVSAANLRDRSTHTGSQATSTVTGLDAALTAKMAKASNLSDLASAATARTNLGVAPTYSNVKHVADFIPAGTDTTSVDCYTWIQAAITAAGVGGTIYLNGRFRCDNELQLLNYQTVVGAIPWMGTGSPITANCVDFRSIVANPSKANQKVGFRVAAGNIFRNLLISGPGTTVADSRGVSTEDAVAASPRFYNVQLINWQRGVHLFGAYYTRMYDCDFQYNGIGLYADACYNLNIYGAKFTCRAADLSSFGTGIYINGLARGLTMHGGSLEDYSIGIRVASQSTVTLSGVYFESPNYAGAVGIDATGLVGYNLDITGCSVYLQNHTYFVKMGTGTNVALNGRGNKFIYSQMAVGDPSPAPTTPIAYNIGLSIGDVFLGGDNWNAVYYQFPNQQSSYTDNSWTLGGVANYDVQFPLTDNGNRHLNHYMGRNIVLPAGKTITTAGILLPVSAKTANYTLTASDSLVSADATSGAIVITLPTAVGVTGRSYTVKRTNSGANTVTVGTTSGQTIDGAATQALSSQWASIRVVSNGANWLIA